MKIRNFEQEKKPLKVCVYKSKNNLDHLILQ
jgi:hypothetical protein